MSLLLRGNVVHGFRMAILESSGFVESQFNSVLLQWRQALDNEDNSTVDKIEHDFPELTIALSQHMAQRRKAEILKEFQDRADAKTPHYNYKDPSKFYGFSGGNEGDPKNDLPSVNDCMRALARIAGYLKAHKRIGNFIPITLKAFVFPQKSSKAHKTTTKTRKTTQKRSNLSEFLAHKLGLT